MVKTRIIQRPDFGVTVIKQEGPFAELQPRFKFLRDRWGFVEVEAVESYEAGFIDLNFDREGVIGGSDDFTILTYTINTPEWD